MALNHFSDLNASISINFNSNYQMSCESVVKSNTACHVGNKIRIMGDEIVEYISDIFAYCHVQTSLCIFISALFNLFPIVAPVFDSNSYLCTDVIVAL